MINNEHIAVAEVDTKAQRVNIFKLKLLRDSNEIIKTGLFQVPCLWSTCPLLIELKEIFAELDLMESYCCNYNRRSNELIVDIL
jgi:hypothetical protein